MRLTSNPTSHYHQCQSALRGRIESGGFESDDQSAREERLCQTHGVSLGTMGWAIKILVGKGWLHGGQGWGVFVTYLLSASAFYPLADSAEDRRLGQEVAPNCPRISTREKVIKGSWLRLANGWSMACEICHPGTHQFKRLKRLWGICWP
jgi:DNA-binding transcriptional MocR family regulator